MANNTDDGLFRRLTQLFRSGPVVKRRVKNFEPNKVSSAFELFQKTQSHVYSSAMSAYGAYDRMARYSDFSEMEYTPEIGSALDIYAEESVSPDEKGRSIHIFSENPTIQKLLDDLFLDTLNVEFNLTSWVRNLCKYGDFFLFNDVSPEYGIINAYPLPVSEVEREEGFDPTDPMSVRFRWVTQGNQVLENWQVSHMRLLGNDAFIPYGSSVLEAARRIWRQLILVEDAMLVYRVVRSPERRVFKIDVGNVPPEDIPTYMEQVQNSLKKSQVVDKDTGRVDLRYNPLSVDEDYFLPVRGSESGTSIETLAGGTNATAIEDVEYIQSKLFAALKVPKAYLGYDEGLGAKATLSQEDIRFSRTIARIQKTIVSELNKIAIIHLFCHGFEGEDLLDFSLKLSNPSTIAQQQKLELYRTRLEIAAQAPEGMVDRKWIRKNVLGMTDKEIDKIIKGRVDDKISDLQVESAKPPGAEEVDIGSPDQSGGALDLGNGGFGGVTSGDSRNNQNKDILLTDPNSKESVEESEEDEEYTLFSITDEDAPIKAQNRVNRFSKILSEDNFNLDEYMLEEEEEEEDQDNPEDENDESLRKPRNRKRPWAHQPIKAPDHSQKGSPDNTIENPYGRPGDLVNPLRDIARIPKISENPDEDSDIEDFLDEKIDQHTKMTAIMRSTLKSLENKIDISRKKIL